MRKFFVTFVSCLLINLVSALVDEQKLTIVADELTAPVEFIGDYSAHAAKKYSTPSELTSLAQSSAQQAKTAVRNQQTASLQASLGAQSGYARAALEAASAAQVALIAKKVIVQNLQKHIEHAAHQLQAEEAQYHQALLAVDAAQNAVQQSQQQLSVTTAALVAVQQSVTQSERAAAAASQAAAAQQQMVEDGKQRLGRLHGKLQEVLNGLQETELAAHKAATAAQQAHANAAASTQLAVQNSAQAEDHDSFYHH